jgi:hypothetical protein
MPPARTREPRVPAKCIEAIRYMFETSPTPDLQQMAEHVGGITTRKLRWLLQQPHVLRWMLTEKQLRLEQASAGNLKALLAIRDRPEGVGNEMAKVHSAKLLEQMLNSVTERTGLGRAAAAPRLPGLSIVLVDNGGGQLVAFEPPRPTQLIEATPTHNEVIPVPTDSESF